MLLFLHQTLRVQHVRLWSLLSQAKLGLSAGNAVLHVIAAVLSTSHHPRFLERIAVGLGGHLHAISLDGEKSRAKAFRPPHKADVWHGGEGLQ